MSNRKGIGGTPSRAPAHAARQRILKVIKASGRMRRSMIAKYFPGISRHVMDKHIQSLRQAGMIEMEAHGVWRPT